MTLWGSGERAAGTRDLPHLVERRERRMRNRGEVRGGERLIQKRMNVIGNGVKESEQSRINRW